MQCHSIIFKLKLNFRKNQFIFSIKRLVDCHGYCATTWSPSYVNAKYIDILDSDEKAHYIGALDLHLLEGGLPIVAIFKMRKC